MTNRDELRKDDVTDKPSNAEIREWNKGGYTGIPDRQQLIEILLERLDAAEAKHNEAQTLAEKAVCEALAITNGMQTKLKATQESLREHMAALGKIRDLPRSNPTPYNSKAVQINPDSNGDFVRYSDIQAIIEAM